MSYLSQKCKKLGGHRLRFGDTISERPPFLTRYGSYVCMSKNIANESLEQNFLCKFLHEWVY